MLPTTQNNRYQNQNSDYPRYHQGFKEIHEALNRCCQLALRQLLPGKQLVLMTDASFQAADYAV